MRGQRKRGRPEAHAGWRRAQLTLINADQFALFVPGRDKDMALNLPHAMAQPFQRGHAVEDIRGVRQVFIEIEVEQGEEALEVAHHHFGGGAMVDMAADAQRRE